MGVKGASACLPKEIEISVLVWKEGETFVSLCPELGVSSCGSDLEEARKRQRAGEDPILYHAPVLLVAHVPKSDRFGRDDAAYAAYNVMLAAQRLGLGTCQIGFLQFALELSRRLRKSLHLPSGRKPEIELVLGVPKYPFRRVVPRREPKITWNKR